MYSPDLATLHSLAPRTADELAESLRDASERGRPVVPWGAGTLQRIGAAPPHDALALATTALNRIIEYNPPDLTITVEAGISFSALQAALVQHHQWLPCGAPSRGTPSVGGLLAVGGSSPLRLGYGAPRDWVLGMRVALGDGRLVKSGGKVVKNVAGYESHKLHIGALGTLGVIVEVTFKVAPLPEQGGTLLIGCATRATALALAERLRARPLAPVSLVLFAHGARALFAGSVAGALPDVLLLVRFAGVATAVERQLRAASVAADTAGATILTLGDVQNLAGSRNFALLVTPAPMRLTEGVLALAQEDGTGGEGSLLLRAGARPSALPALLDALERYAPPADAPPQIVGYGGLGLAYARWPLADTIDAPMVVRAVAVLRAALAAEDGYAVIEDAPDYLRPHLDLWGAPPPTLPLMRALKAQWDPQGILNPGRYIGGL
jgi:glycolate oxidase FAD binding subunit